MRRNQGQRKGSEQLDLPQLLPVVCEAAPAGAETSTSAARTMNELRESNNRNVKNVEYKCLSLCVGVPCKLCFTFLFGLRLLSLQV